MIIFRLCVSQIQLTNASACISVNENLTLTDPKIRISAGIMIFMRNHGIYGIVEIFMMTVFIIINNSFILFPFIFV